MKQKFIESVLDELCKVLDTQQLDFVENTLEQKLLSLDIIEQITNEELVSQENDELLTAFRCNTFTLLIVSVLAS